MRYLVDTSWIIEHLRGNRGVTQRLLTLEDEGIAISVVSVAELYEGVYRSNNPTGNGNDVRDFLNTVTVLGVDEEVCVRFGMEQARLSRSGGTLSEFDLVIAATALHHGLTILTSDRDFARVENLQIIFL